MKINKRTAFAVAGGIGVVVTAVLSARAGSKCSKKLSKLPLESTAKDKAKAVWKDVVPAVVSLVATETCLVMAEKTAGAEIAAAAASLALVKQQFSKYREAVVEEVGEEREKEIRQSIAHNEVLQSVDGLPETTHLYHFDISDDDGVWIECSTSEVLKAIDHMNRYLFGDGNYSGDGGRYTLEMFFDQLHYKCDKAHSKYLTTGWITEDLVYNWGVYWMEFTFDHQVDHNGREYIHVHTPINPHKDIRAEMIELENQGLL